jgi:hypothetical protein
MDAKWYSKAHKWAGTYGKMSKLKNKLLTKLLDPSFKKRWPETIRKQVYMLGFFQFEAIWAPPYKPKKVLKGPQVGGTYDPIP